MLLHRTGGRNRGDYWNSAMHAEFVAEVSNYPGSADFAVYCRVVDGTQNYGIKTKEKK